MCRSSGEDVAMNHRRDKSKTLQKRAWSILPLGVNSNFRYWGEGVTPYVDKAKGAYLWDVDGNRYIDYRLAFGPIILGHAYDGVDKVVQDEISRGVLYAMTSELEIALAEKFISMCPALEMIRLACSGTESTMHAIRLARAYTKREKIIKFEGMYHGFQDYTLFSTYATPDTYGSRNAPIPIPASSGIPNVLTNLIITLPFNDFEILEDTLRRAGGEVAALITEPCMGNCGAIEPEPGFLKFIQEKCHQYGIVFILDEVKTGFRLARGGAQEYFGLDPDLSTYAKALGNGYPIAALGGKREIMSYIGHGVAQGGTYTNNKCGVAAASATLEIIQTQPVIETINHLGKKLMAGIQQIFDDEGIPACVNGYPGIFSFAIGKEKVIDQRTWAESDHDLYLKIVEALIQRGIMPDFDAREPWFICYSHTEEMIDETMNIMADIIKTVKNQLTKRIPF
jgi:glutamate-1-semialdehyde 2,1-aminomutase